MTSAQAAEKAGVTRATIFRWTKTGKLPYRVTRGKRKRLVIDAEVLAMVLAGTPIKVV